ncbi:MULTISPECIES: hypothetical protein [Pseudomonas]|jgi:hypothetical protein|uniref:hypothetical protein n=1 Tax=Pseudomonas TaxID=286 RepID=UPI000989DA38|nr:hypothetical protein [Pseudomonas sp. FSL W5-0299]OOL36151.1 hypothetical protein BOO94_20115 [Pseudomonas sp. FSL W5-0299]
MHKLIKLDEATVGFIELDMPLYSIIYSCWREARTLNVREFVQLTRRMIDVSDSTWLQRKTSRELGYETSSWRLDEVKHRCMALIEKWGDPQLDIVQVSSEDVIFQQLQKSLEDEVNVGRQALLFLFISTRSVESDKRVNWLRAGFMAQQLSVIAADGGLGSFASHGHEHPSSEAYGGLNIEYVLWIG